MNDAESALPLFVQVEANLRQRILTNQLEAGSKLPSEAELEVDFGVSRITVRQALAALRAAGLIRKENGKGSFVTRPTDSPDLGPLTGFYEHMRAHGRKAHGQTISVRSIRATSLHAHALGIAEGELLSAVTILRIVDDRPLAVGLTVGVPKLMKSMQSEDMENNDVMAILEGRLGYRLRSTHVESSAVAAGKLHARQLLIGENDPVLRMRFTPHDTADQPVCWSEMHFRGDAFSYRVVVNR
ncbi:MAG: GntR family transcriptional regulator [Rhodoferax sp.]|nr:GntR family transcriptional regulator [Rhodoferax sp.]